MVKLILFDCDGTLVDSEYVNNRALVEVLHGLGLTQYTVEYALEHFTGLRFRNIAELISAETGFVFPENTRDLYVNRAKELAKDYLKPIEGARALAVFALAHFDACVVSNGERNNVLRSLSAVGIKDLFDEAFIFTGLMAPNPKPAPDLFLLAAARKGVDPVHCLVLEDSVTGVRAGAAAGMRVWGFSGAHGDEYGDKLLNAGAEKVFGSMEAIQRKLNVILTER